MFILCKCFIQCHRVLSFIYLHLNRCFNFYYFQTYTYIGTYLHYENMKKIILFDKLTFTEKTWQKCHNNKIMNELVSYHEKFVCWIFGIWYSLTQPPFKFSGVLGFPNFFDFTNIHCTFKHISSIYSFVPDHKHGFPSYSQHSFLWFFLDIIFCDDTSPFEMSNFYFSFSQKSWF